MRRILRLLILIVALLWLGRPAAGAVEGQAAQAVEYTFGGQVQFRLALAADQAPSAVQVFLRNQGDEQVWSGAMTLAGSEAVYVHDLTQHPLRAFSTVEYWFSITPQTGEAHTTEIKSFLYLDNRYQWQVIDDTAFRIHWYEGDASFGESLLAAARQGAERAFSLLPVSQSQPVDIYVYASGKELQSTLRLGGLNWVAGHADPELSLMVVSLPAGPDQKRETERQIPHELMHILLYQTVGEGYALLPTWFKEGLASANELSPNPDYFKILTTAVEDEALISLSQLCQSFPQDTSVYLAYAEADRFVRYLHEKYGAQGLGGLLQSYAGGESCELGPQAALGLPLERLENDWRREELGEFAMLSALMNMLPWMLVLGLALLVPMATLLFSMRKGAAKKGAKVSYG